MGQGWVLDLKNGTMLNYSITKGIRTLRALYSESS